MSQSGIQIQTTLLSVSEKELCDQTRLESLIQQQLKDHNNGCMPIAVAFTTGGNLTQKIVCDCVNGIDEDVLKDFQCYVQQTDVLMLSQVQPICRTFLIIILFVRPYVQTKMFFLS